MTAEPKRKAYERPEVKELLDVREHVTRTGGGCSGHVGPSKAALLQLEEVVISEPNGCTHGR